MNLVPSESDSTKILPLSFSMMFLASARPIPTLSALEFSPL